MVTDPLALARVDRPGRAERVVDPALVPVLAGALVVGGAFVVSPLLAIGLVAAGALGLLCLRIPVAVLCLGVLSSAVALDQLAPFAGMGPVGQAQRWLVFASLVPILVRRGLRERLLPLPALAYTSIAVFTATVAKRYAGLSPLQIVTTVLVLSLGWWCTAVVLHPAEQRRTLIAIGSVAPASLAAGAVLQAAGIHTLFLAEYTGVARMQGATIPAYLGLIAAGGCAAGALLVRMRHTTAGGVIVAVNVAVAAASLTRGALICCALVLVPLAWRVVRGGSTRSERIIRTALAVTALTMVAAVVAPQIATRNSVSSDTEASGGASSGRALAWAYFLDAGDGAEDFGTGIGSSALIGLDGADQLPGDFRAPHNEYLRVYLEAGAIGAVIVMIATAVAIAQLWRRTPRLMRPEIGWLIAAFAIYSITDNTMSTPMLWVPFGLILGIAAQQPPPGLGWRS
jgi:teichuronic acid biosynthesis protein TuaE